MNCFTFGVFSLFVLFGGGWDGWPEVANYTLVVLRDFFSHGKLNNMNFFIVKI